MIDMYFSDTSQTFQHAIHTLSPLPREKKQASPPSHAVGMLPEHMTTKFPLFSSVFSM
jgi:hypothetical protein